jgi:hypothetical protein
MQSKLDRFHEACCNVRTSSDLIRAIEESKSVIEDVPLSFGRPLDIEELIRGKITF